MCSLVFLYKSKQAMYALSKYFYTFTQTSNGENKKALANTRAFLFIWQRIKDSNLDERFWRPSCYHYTNPL